MVTNLTSLRETPTWQKGHNGEKLIADSLQQRGWYVIPSYDYSGDDNNQAPKLQGQLTGYVIPDLDIAKDGTRRWAEVKTKAHADWTVITQRYEHGFKLRHYHHYLKVQKITGCEVWIFIYEEDTGDVLYARLDDLTSVRREYLGDKMDKGGTVFFPRDAFRLWLTLKPKSEQLEMTF